MPAYNLNLYDQSPLPMFRKPKPVDELQMWRERAERAEKTVLKCVLQVDEMVTRFEALLQSREKWAEDRRLELLHENLDLKIKNCRLYDEVKDLLATIANLEAAYDANLKKAQDIANGSAPEPWYSRYYPGPLVYPGMSTAKLGQAKPQSASANLVQKDKQMAALVQQFGPNSQWALNRQAAIDQQGNQAVDPHLAYQFACGERQPTVSQAQGYPQRDWPSVFGK